MTPSPKIATCCYCGARAALVLKGKSRHELACASCGAPLHEMKSLKVDHEQHGARELVRPSRIRGSEPKKKKPKKSYRKPQKKRRKSFFSNAFEEVFDVIEDIFD